MEWGLLRGVRENYAPSIVWHTECIPEEDSEKEPCAVLKSFLCHKARDLVFLGDDIPDRLLKHNATEAATKREVPLMTVYLLVKDNIVEERVKYLFKDVPARLFRLNPNHFSIDTIDSELDTENTGCYSSLYNRLSSLCAARHFYPGRFLLIHAEVAICYTIMNHEGKIVGSGDIPGFVARFLKPVLDPKGNPYLKRSKYPKIAFEEYMKECHIAADANEPMPVFSGSEKEMAIVADATTDIANFLRKIIREFVNGTNGGNDGDRTIPTVLFDGDGVESRYLSRLILEDSSPDRIPNEEFSIQIHHRLFSYGVQQLLLKEQKAKGPPSPDENLRERVVGLRGAVAKTLRINNVSTPGTHRGTFARVVLGRTFDEDLFELVFENGEKDYLDLTQMYGAFITDWSHICNCSKHGYNTPHSSNMIVCCCFVVLVAFSIPQMPFDSTRKLVKKCQTGTLKIGPNRKDKPPPMLKRHWKRITT